MGGRRHQGADANAGREQRLQQAAAQAASNRSHHRPSLCRLHAAGDDASRAALGSAIRITTEAAIRHPDIRDELLERWEVLCASLAVPDAPSQRLGRRLVAAWSRWPRRYHGTAH
jgi:hypothetical protein